MLLIGGNAAAQFKPAAPGATMQEKNVASGTATLYVRVSGPATAERALIVIAGGPGASHHYIRALEQMANDKRRVALFDQRGVGSSTAPATSRRC